MPRDQVAYDEADNNPQAYKTYGGSVKARYDFGAIDFTSITAYETTSGYSRGDTDGGAAVNFPVNGVPNGYGQSMGRIRDLDQWTQEFRLASHDDSALRGRPVRSTSTAATPPTSTSVRGSCRVRPQPEQLGATAQQEHLVGRFRPAELRLHRQVHRHGRPAPDQDEKHTRLLKTADTAGVVTYKGRTDVKMSDTTRAGI